jgi:hypothetical protein
VSIAFKSAPVDSFNAPESALLRHTNRFSFLRDSLASSVIREIECLREGKAKYCHFQTIRKSRNLGMYKLMAMADGSLLPSAPALVCVVCSTDVRGTIDAGRLFTRLWMDLNQKENQGRWPVSHASGFLKTQSRRFAIPIRIPGFRKDPPKPVDDRILVQELSGSHPPCGGACPRCTQPRDDSSGHPPTTPTSSGHPQFT